MSRVLFYIGTILIMTGLLSARHNWKPVPVLVASADTIILSSHIDTVVPAADTYTSLEYTKVELLRAAPGTKSVLFNTDGSRLYAMNLEGMSVYEFDRPSRKVIRQFKFKPTRGI